MEIEKEPRPPKFNLSLLDRTRVSKSAVGGRCTAPAHTFGSRHVRHLIKKRVESAQWAVVKTATTNNGPKGPFGFIKRTLGLPALQSYVGLKKVQDRMANWFAWLLTSAKLGLKGAKASKRGSQQRIISPNSPAFPPVTNLPPRSGH